MTGRDSELRSPYPDLVLRSRPNWTAVGFLGLLATLHTCNALPAFLAGRWEGYLSSCFALMFVGLSVATYHTRCEVAVLHARRLVRSRAGLGRLSFEHHVAFAHVRGVRVTRGGRA